MLHAKNFQQTIIVAVILTIAVSWAYSQTDPANDAFNRGRKLFLASDYTNARKEFQNSFGIRATPLTAYFLSDTYFQLRDFNNAKSWANVTLSMIPPAVLAQDYVNGAKTIIDYSTKQLAPKPAPASTGTPGLGMTGQAIESVPTLPTPGEMTASGFSKSAAVANANRGVKPAATVLAVNGLTGTWKGDDGGTYYVRQTGNELWWYGKDANGGQSWSNVFHGSISGSRISGTWADVPPGAANSSGILVIDIQGNSRMTATQKTGGFGGSNWMR